MQPLQDYFFKKIHGDLELSFSTGVDSKLQNVVELWKEKLSPSITPNIKQGLDVTYQK